MRSKNILDLTDFNKNELGKLIQRSIYFKKNWKRKFNILNGKRVGLLFDSASLRTKVSFEVAAHKLGGFTYFVNIGSVTHEEGAPRESFEDIAATMDRFVDLYVVRDYSQKMLNVLKRKSNPPVINGFSVVGHPSQAIADLSTIFWEKGDITGLNISAVCSEKGSGVIESFVYGVLLLGGNVILITPSGKFAGKNKDFYDQVRKMEGKFRVTKNVQDTMKSIDVLYVDEWWYPGSDFLKKKPPKKYRVDREFIKNSKRNLIILHCLPAHYDREISEEIITSDRSVVFDEAEFRVYSAMALFEYLAKK